MSGADMSGPRENAGLADVELLDDAPAHPAMIAATASDAMMNRAARNRGVGRAK
jgi:hypothetical protein